MSKNNRYIHKRTLPGKVIGSLFGFPLVENNFPPDLNKPRKHFAFYRRNPYDVLIGWSLFSPPPADRRDTTEEHFRKYYEGTFLPPDKEKYQAECEHEHLDEEGICRRCGLDCRGIH